MHIKLAYLTLVLIWSTTPLAIQWSSADSPFFAVAIRMSLGFVCCWAFVLYKGIKLPLNKQFWTIYSVAGFSVFLGMVLVYISAQTLPSGWISVLHGLLPIVTGIFAYFYLSESNMTQAKVIGMLLGLAGLALVFASSLELNESAISGIIYCLSAVVIFGLSAVLIKRLNQKAQLSSLEINVGGLTLTAPLCLITWLCFADPLIPVITWKSALSITYLGVLATSLGFTLYYFLLKKVDATKVSLIALITPVVALILGSWINNEPIVANVWLGALLIFAGLVFFEIDGKANWQKLKKYWKQL